MLIANRGDYKRGYKKHYALYKRLRRENSDVNSRRLLLIYSVECGLKYKLLDKWQEENTEKILNGQDEKKKKVLVTHDLEKLIKAVGQQGNFKFPSLVTVHKNSVSPETYHQVYRYCIRIQEKEQKKEEMMEEILEDIACWLEEGM